MDISDLSGADALEWLRKSAQAMLDDEQLRANLPDELIAALQDLLQPQPSERQIEDGMQAISAVTDALEDARQFVRDTLLTDLSEELKDWYQAPTWSASRRWLTAHISALPPDAPDQFEAAARVHETDQPDAAAALKQHATLLRQARATDIESAYRAIIGDEAFAPESEEELAAERLTELGDLLEDWFDTPDWDASRAFLAAHADQLLTDDAETVLSLLSDNEDDADTQEILEDHLILIQDAREVGIDAAYQALQAEIEEGEDEEDDEDEDDDDDDEFEDEDDEDDDDEDDDDEEEGDE